MKIIWGFDLGVNSVGSGVVGVDEEGKPEQIMHLGVRRIPMTDADTGKDGAFAQFVSGNTISKNAKRTQRRTQRKGYDRYQMRRATLVTALRRHGMLPDDTCSLLDKLALWSLRSRAVSENITLPELGRVLLHLNQKRGYKSARAEGNTKEDTDYVKAVNGRYEALREQGLTVGQYLYGELIKDGAFRVKDRVYPRAAYVEEFDRIMATQRIYYPDVLTDELIARFRDEIIYRQRPLKSCKGLVAVCEFEGRKQTVRGHERFCGPKVAPRSSPLAQVCRVWEQINHIRITNKAGELYSITPEQKTQLAAWLNTAAKVTWTQLKTLLKLKNSDGWHADQRVEKSGLRGNDTYVKIAMAFGSEPVPEGLLDFPLTEIAQGKSDGSGPAMALLYDCKSGEVLCEEPALCISPDIEQSSFYRLWHTIYSIADMEECAGALMAKFPEITPEVAARLAAIDFRSSGFSNKSAKAIRKILPYLSRGYVYSQAMALAGYNHSGSQTEEQRRNRPLKERLDLLPKNALRQPVVEKVLNQLINVSNAMLEQYGRPDEIRIELARELKQSKEERENSARRMGVNERENKRLAERIETEYPGVRCSRRNIEKFKLYQELSVIGHKCIYCGKSITLSEALTGDQVDIEHIIPRSLLFDDSMSNKTLSHRLCNREKSNRTAFDYMQAKPETEFAAYLERVELLCAKDRTKRNKLLMPAHKIPTDFIDRQLRQSQYIARKAVEILSDICTKVWSTSGSVTAYLRRVWGWDEALMQLRLPRYREVEGGTEWIEYQRGGQIHRTERIVGWSKRDDHRHHAVDALVIACTRQGYIQRLNTLSRQTTQEYMKRVLAEASLGVRSGDRAPLLERYLESERPFTTAEVMEQLARVLISTKPGKRVTTPGVRKAGAHGERRVVQRVLVPRGPLSEESVYGNVRTPVCGKDGALHRFPVKYLVEHPDLIVSKRIRQLVEERLARFDHDARAAFRSLKKEPLLLSDGTPLTGASCYSDEYVIRYRLNGDFGKADDIIDPQLRAAVRARLAAYGGKAAQAFAEPFEWQGHTVRSVRCYTGLNDSSVEAVRYDSETGAPVGFVKPGNNHHIAFYRSSDGTRHYQICTFWHAVERKRFGLPVIIRNPAAVWDAVQIDADRFPQSFLDKLPSPDWQYEFCLQQNEMVVLGLDRDVVRAAIEQKDHALLGEYIYRVQKMSVDDKKFAVTFRHQYETSIQDTPLTKATGRYYLVQSLGRLDELIPVKVRIDLLGQISEVEQP